MEELRPDITCATDHQSYLRGLFAYNKSVNKIFSHAYCAKRLKVAPSYLKNIFSKRRILNLELVIGLAALFRLSTFETQFLTVLVVRDHIEEKDIRTYFDGVLSSLRFEARELRNDPVFKVPEKSQQILNDPLLHLLHSLVRLKNFRPEAEWVKGCISKSDVTNEQITSGYRQLLKQGVIEEKKGRYFIKSDFTYTSNSFDLESTKIHRAGLQEVDEALGNITSFKPYGLVFGHFVVDEEGGSRISKAFHQFCREAIAIEKGCTDPDRVIGVSNSFLTLARE